MSGYPKRVCIQAGGIHIETSEIRSSISMATDYQRRKKPVRTKEKFSEASRWLADDIEKVMRTLEHKDYNFKEDRSYKQWQ